MAQQTRESEVGDARIATAIYQNIVLHVVRLQLNGTHGGLTYTFEVCVHGWPVVQVFQPTSDIRQLKKQRLWAVASHLGQNTHQFKPVGLRTRNDEVHDSTVFHPLGNHHQAWWREFRSYQP